MSVSSVAAPDFAVAVTVPVASDGSSLAIGGFGRAFSVPEERSSMVQTGASIAPTLRARASSLRVQLLAEEEAAANTASEKLTAPVALLSIAFLLLFLYPALARLMAS